MYDLLNSINSPIDLRQLRPEELPTLATELRNFLLETVSKTGGHLSSNLGTVELTIALHYTFQTPYDRLVWDVGHQTYPHKILTGRRERMATLRQLDGLSGFPKRSESEYDDFGTAHSSTSISAALGMAIAAQLKNEQRAAVAIIGDGAMTAGMAFEALNNAGIHKGLPLLVILNDNEMSISPPVGALSRYLARLLSGNFYTATKRGFDKFIALAPDGVVDFAKRFEEHTKGMLVPGTMFEEFGFRYIGPVDGHDLATLVPTLQNMRELILSGDNRPQFLHVVTKKGHGYKLAENDPILYHGPGKFDPAKGIIPNQQAPKTYTQIFSDWICAKGEKENQLVAITPAMREGSGLVEFEKRFPNRYFDVGIAEQHAVTFAAGLATENLKPIVAIYSTFLQRAYDQLIHDVALQNLDVTFAIDRAGLVGADGATHAGAYDLAFLRCIPNMVVMTPSDENEAWHMLDLAYQHKGPAAVRYPRGAGTGVVVDPSNSPLEMGRGVVRRRGQKLALLAFGSMVKVAKEVGEKLNATVVDMRFVKPIDETIILEMAASHDTLVALEEGCMMGGAGSAIAETLNQHKVTVPYLQLGLPDQFIDQGDTGALLARCGLDPAGVEKHILAFLAKPSKK